VLHIMSSKTQNSEVIRTLTQSCEASGKLQAGLPSQRTLEVGFLRSRSRWTLEAVDVAVIVLPDTHQFLPIST
jgi:hypothetical protein